MTVGKDVSTLFPDVINCIQTGMFLDCGFKLHSIMSSVIFQSMFWPEYDAKAILLILIKSLI
jgi:hypothetical protein